MRIAAVQHDIVWEDRDANFARLAPQIAAAATTGARIIVLSEMFATGFTMNTAKIAEPSEGPTTRFLRAQAALHDAWVGGSLAELPDGCDKPFNTFVMAGPRGEMHRYRKIHPFTYGREHEHFASGSEFATIDIDGMRVSLFVCYDLRFADEFWQVAADTDLYLVPGNWPHSRRLHWQSLLVARAIENQAYVLGCNRVGQSTDTVGSLRYAGDSMIVDPLGETLASAAGGESLVVADIDQAAVAAIRKRFPFLPDRRPGK